ncbi:MAG: hypothetical protein H0Z28_09050 [Archaeoglobus sp.]|nr:hypothetical protein [Archaeoglobus sp.]
MGLGKALMFLGVAFIALLTPGLYIIYPYQVSLVLKVIFYSYILVLIFALIILTKGIDKIAMWLRETKEKRRKERIKAWEIQTLENYYS